MNLTDEELEEIEKIQTSEEWKALCLAVKGRRNGQYPPDWYPKVLASGLADRVLARFGEDAQIRIVIPAKMGEK